MMRMIVAFTLLTVFVVTGAAQTDTPDLGLYAVSHLYALPTATTTRLFGMGGFASCIPDDGFGNPAFAGILETNHAVVRCSSTRFDSGMKLRSQQYSVAIPIEEGKRGMQLTGLRLTSTPAPPAGIPGAPAIGYREWHMALHYGQRLGDGWSVGLSVSPVFHNSTEFTMPGPPGEVARFRASVDRGARLGAAYEWDQNAWAGLVYDRYREDVTASGLAFGGQAVEERFSSEAIIVGVSAPVHERALGAVEWQQLTTRGAGTRLRDAGFRIGVEALVADDLKFRIGTNNGAFSAGAGYEGGNWAVEYAFINNWNHDSVGEVFGGSDTHQFEVKYRW